MGQVPISKIVVGERHRRQLGNIDALAANIGELGLLHPDVVRRDGLLVAGERRLEACKRLGWRSIPATVVDLKEIVKGEFAENAMRKDFLPSEVEAIRRALEPYEKAAAQRRMRMGRAPSGKFPEGLTGQTRDKVGAFAGMSGRTVEKVTAIVKAAEQNPRKFGTLVEEMDRTGRVDGVYRKLRQAQDESHRLAIQPVEGKFRTIVLDPPYSYRQSLAGRARPDYAVMSQKQLLALPVADWAESEAHIYVWAPNNCLPEALELMVAWGFSFTTVLTWIKPRFGLGSYFRASTEQCLFGVRGRLMTRARNIPTHFEARAGRHSDKPDEFFRLVERASYPGYLEVFARKRRKNWSAWGAGMTGGG
jgi:N6-adenosine-specific RNA methylase IME4